MAQDPICGMNVDEKSSVKITKDGKHYYFCSLHCMETFIRLRSIKDPQVSYPQAKKPFYEHKLFIVTCIPAVLIALSFVLPFLVPFRDAFVVYFRKIWWAVALGLVLGGVIDYYIPREYISKLLARRKPSTIVNAVLLGFLMSACSHGILALSIQLHKKGASNPAVVSFLLASPWANFAVTMMLVAFFGVKGLFIIAAAIIIALNTGFIFMFLEKKGLIEKNKNTVDVAHGFSITADMRRRIKEYRFGPKALEKDSLGILQGALALSDMVLWWIILGVVIASLAGAYIPLHFFQRFMGPTAFGLIVTLMLATIMEVCSEGTAPFAFEIFRQTGALGNSFVFLMAGVITDYTEIGLLWTNVGRNVALWMPAVTVPQVVALGYLANHFLK